jgi:hypothetical protein
LTQNRLPWRETVISLRNGAPTVIVEGRQVREAPMSSEIIPESESRTRETNSEQGLLLAILIMVILGVIAIFLVTA